MLICFRIRVEDGSSGNNGVDLLFKNIAMKDRGTYTCSANVDGIDLKTSFELKVYSKLFRRLVVAILEA